MTITVKQAIRHFFPTPSFEMIYSEAVANALDAGATQIDISIAIKSFQAKETIKMLIRDNGQGFTDENFKRFTSLMQSKDDNHKGLGRLVYLAYFNKVHVESSYAGTGHRLFDFTDDFNGECIASQLSEVAASYSQFAFSEFSNAKFSKYDDLKPIAIRDLLKKMFMARMFFLKAEKKQLQINISLDVAEPNSGKGFVPGSATLTLDDLPDLQTYDAHDGLSELFENKFHMLYTVMKDEWRERATASICVDGRAIPFPSALKNVELPSGISAIFMLQSSYFDAKADDSRQTVKLTAAEEREVVRLFQKMIADVLQKEVPAIKERNDRSRKDLEEKYPHLNGMFPEHPVGLMNASRALEHARDKFFGEQRDILEAKEMDDALYAKSLQHAARVLAEYILYRKVIIEKLSRIDVKDREAKIHDIIVPMQRTFDKTTCIADLYNNNAWVLDDKYMTYKAVLSDKDLAALVEKIAFERDDLKTADVRPDIAIVFSEDIDKTEHPVDVVVVELKRKGLGYLDNMRIYEQIKMRARRLASLYPNKIQRMWFFGVVEFDKELKIEMKEDKWTPIYSSGDVYYRQLEVVPVDKDLNELSDKPVLVPVTLMSYDALIGDAKARNSTFLDLLRNSIKTYAVAGAS